MSPLILYLHLQIYRNCFTLVFLSDAAPKQKFIGATSATYYYDKYIYVIAICCPVCLVTCRDASHYIHTWTQALVHLISLKYLIVDFDQPNKIMLQVFFYFIFSHPADITILSVILPCKLCCLHGTLYYLMCMCLWQLKSLELYC